MRIIIGVLVTMLAAGDLQAQNQARTQAQYGGVDSVTLARMAPPAELAESRRIPLTMQALFFADRFGHSVLLERLQSLGLDRAPVDAASLTAVCGAATDKLSRTVVTIYSAAGVMRHTLPDECPAGNREVTARLEALRDAALRTLYSGIAG